MLAGILALAAAVGYGVSDFAAGVASRRVDLLAVTFVGTVCSLAVSILALPWMAGHAPSAAALAWGAGGGLGGMAGALCLYAGFRRAAFSVAGPLSAVSSAGLSVIAGVALGERPSALSVAGIVAALPAIVLVSLTAAPAGEDKPDQRGPGTGQASALRLAGIAPTLPGTARLPLTAAPDSQAEPGRAGSAGAGAVDAGPVGAGPVGAGPAGAGPGGGGLASGGPAGSEAASAGSAAAYLGSAVGRVRHGAPAGVGLGLAAGAGFALLFVGLNRAGPAAGVWPVIAGQVAEVIVLVGVLAGTGRALTRLRGAVALPVLTGVSGGGATILYFVATHKGFLAIAAVLTSLYPAVTIGLARVFASERLSATRLAGLVLAGASVTLIALGGTG